MVGALDDDKERYNVPRLSPSKIPSCPRPHFHLFPLSLGKAFGGIPAWVLAKTPLGFWAGLGVPPGDLG